MAKRWKNFIAYDYADLRVALEKAFIHLEYQYSGGHCKESINLGSKENSYLYKVKIGRKDEIQIKVLEAVADPVTKVASYVVGSRKHFGGACFLEITPFNEDVRAIVKSIFQIVFETSKREPWDLSYHPRFRLAILLRLQIKTGWKKLLR